MDIGELTEPEMSILRALWANDMSGNTEGLTAVTALVHSKIVGRPIDMRVGDTGRLIHDMARRGLVRVYRRSGGTKRQFRLTHAGRKLMLGVEQDNAVREIPSAVCEFLQPLNPVQ